MCGVVASWRKDGGMTDADELMPMLTAIAHRGPDGMGKWSGGRTALGLCRLSIIDPSPAGNQPMVTADQTGALAYNGEIYNFPELRAELARAGVRFNGRSDSEVVLQALHQWGPEVAIPRFNGMFAFAYVDLRQPAMWLCRDRLGIKPLFVADLGAELLVASEPKALIAHPRVPRQIDLSALLRGIAHKHFLTRACLFDGIEEVAPGNWWKVTREGIARHRYFDMTREIDVDRLVAADRVYPSEFVKTFDHVLSKSVGQHLVSDAPVAVLCSGGVDSSLITALAHETNPQIMAYTADPPATGEGAQAERVGRHLGVEVRRIEVDRERFLRLWPQSVWFSDGPPLQQSNPALLAVTQASHADGIKVLLAGEGSDEMFAGYRWQHATYRRWRRASWLERWLPFASNLGRRPYKASVGEVPIRPSSGHTPLVLSLDPDDELFPRIMFEHLKPVSPVADRALLVHCLWQLHLHLGWLLHRHDRMGMGASIETRVPFLENAMIDFALHLPRRAKLHRGVGKWVVKQAACARLPADVVFARKKAFPIPSTYARSSEGLLVGGLLADTLGWSSSATRTIVADVAALPEFRFLIVSIELWLRMAFAGENADALGERLVALAKAA